MRGPAGRGADDPPDRREAVALQEPGGRLVGRDHEVLDQVLGAVAPVLLQAGHPFAFENGPDLVAPDVQGAALVADLPQPLGGLVLEADLIVEPRDRREAGRRRGALFEPGGQGVVGELRAVVNDGPVEVRLPRRAVFVDDEIDDHGQAVLPLVERGDPGREPLGEHGEDLGRGIDRGRVVPRVLVDGRTLGDPGVDVRDRDQDPDAAIVERLRHRELVEVAGVVVVDRGPEEAPQVADPVAGDAVAGRRTSARPRLSPRGRTRGGSRGRSSLSRRWPQARNAGGPWDA